MKTFPRVLPAFAAAFMLAACGGGSQSSAVSAEDIQAAQKSPEAAQPFLIDRSGKIRLGVPFALTLEDSTADTETLRAADDMRDITLSVVRAGKSTDPAEYFSRLSGLLQNSGYRDVQTAIAENRMSYQFTSAQDGTAVNESCLALYTADNELFNVCALSAVQPFSTLNAYLQDVRTE